jgi:hypothetical protein
MGSVTLQAHIQQAALTSRLMSELHITSVVAITILSDSQSYY